MINYKKNQILKMEEGMWYIKLQTNEGVLQKKREELQKKKEELQKKKEELQKKEKALQKKEKELQDEEEEHKWDQYNYYMKYGDESPCR